MSATASTVTGSWMAVVGSAAVLDGSDEVVLGGSDEVVLGGSDEVVLGA